MKLALMLAASTSFAVLAACPVRAQKPPASSFDAAWRGWDTGVHTTASTYAPVAQALADFDGDGQLDAAFANVGDFITPAISVIRSDGHGGYLPPEIYATPKETGAIVAEDFTGDGRADMATTNGAGTSGGSGASFFRNLGNGLFAAGVLLPTGNEPTGIVAIDYDVDGDLDLAIAITAGQAGATVMLERNDGAGVFTAGPTLGVGTAPRGLTAADLNADGRTDLVVQNDSIADGWRLRVLLNAGGGSFAAPDVYVLVPGFTGGVGARVGVGDLDADGDPDLVAAAIQFMVLRNDGTGHFAAPQPVAGSFGGQPAFALADVTGNGTLDIVHADNGTCDVIAGNGNGTFNVAAQQFFSSGDTPVAVDALDLDADGDMDVVTTCRESLEFCVHGNRGNGDFSPLHGYAAATLSFELTTGDVDGDGDLDVATCALDDISILRNRGDATFDPVYQVPNPVGAQDLQLRDLDDDGRADLLWVPRGENPPYHFYTKMNGGTGDFGPLLTWPIDTCGNGPVDAFDIDADGDLDVVVGEHLGCPGIFGSGRRLFIGRNDGTGNFELLPPVVLNVHPESLAAGDFNEDGMLDLTTGFDLLLGHGDFAFEPAQSLGVTPLWWVVAGDCNADGHLDLLGADNGQAGPESAYVRFGNGAGGFAPPQVLLCSFSAALSAVPSATAGDYDGDGDLDLVAANSGSHDLSFFENTGSGVLAAQERYGVAGSVSNGSGPSEVVTADMNGDGIDDVVTLADDQVPFHSAVFVLAGHDAGPWTDLGGGLAGSFGVPALSGAGELAAGTPGQLDLSSAKPLSASGLFLSLSSTPAPFKGGMLVPVPVLLVLPFATDAGGHAMLGWSSWPVGVPPATTIYFQSAVHDTAALAGLALSNALLGTTP